MTRDRRTQVASTTSDTSGRYSVDLTGDWDVRAGDETAARVTLPSGHTAGVSVRIPQLLLLLEEARVSGTADPSVTVEVSLRDELGSVRASGTSPATETGFFSHTLSGPSGIVLPRPGDTVIVEYGVTVVAMLVPELTAVADAAADEVSGTASPGGRVTVTAYSPPGERPAQEVVSATPGADGRWTAQFAALMDLRAGSRLEVRYTTADGHVAGIDRTVPVIHVQSGGNRVHGQLASGVAVNVRVRRGGIELEAATEADGAGLFDVRLTELGGDPFEIKAGDEVEVSWTPKPAFATQFSVLGGAPAQVPQRVAMDVALITASIDVDLKTVQGMTTVTTPVQIVIRPPGGAPFALGTGSGQSGTYSQVLSESLEPLAAGLAVEAGIIDPNGHRTYALAVVPWLDVTLGQRQLLGRAGPLASVGLALRRGTSSLGSALAVADTEGWFAANLPAAPAPEMELRLTEPGGRQTTVVLPELWLTLDRVEPAVDGMAPPSHTVEVRLHPQSGPPFSVNVRAGSNGEWRLTPADLPTGAPALATLQTVDARVLWLNGHRVTAIEGGPRGTSGGTTLYLPAVRTS
jgi:hypothetical protein